MKTIGKIRRCISLLLIFTICIVNYNNIYAEDKQNLQPVEINLLSVDQIQSRKCSAKIEIMFHDMNYYNEQVYLSYHIFNSKDLKGVNEAVKYENDRIPVKLDSNNRMEMELSFNLTSLNYETLYVQFDLVDQKNLYWFSAQDLFDFTETGFLIQYNKTYEIFQPLIEAVRFTPIIFLINISAFLGVIFLMIYIKKKQLLKW